MEILQFASHMGMDEKSKSELIRLIFNQTYFFPRPEENQAYVESELSTSYVLYLVPVRSWEFCCKLGAKYTERPGI